MKKTLTRIIGVTLSLALMVGVGVGINGNKATPALADGEAEVGDFELFTQSLTEGNYIIYYNGKAAKNTITSNRLDYLEVTPSNNIIAKNNATANIIWHIANDTTEGFESYYTIYNAAINKYLASTNSNNQAKLEATISNNSRWTAQGSYEFINKARDEASSNNKYLRNKGTYGFACYASGTGGALSLYKQKAGILLDETTATISVGFNTQLTATLVSLTGSISWQSSDDTVAEVDQNGIVTGVAAGDAVITAFVDSNTDGNIDQNEPQASCLVTVTAEEIHAESISLNTNSLSLYVGDSGNLTATLDPANAPDQITWETSDENIAAVDQNGLVTGVAAGEATITATANGHSDSCTVTVSIEHGRLQSDPLTVSEAIALGSSLANNAQTTKDYFVGGFVSQTIAVFNEGVAKFWLADGETVIKGFQCYNVTAGVGVDTSDLRVGAEAIIHCNIKKYVNQTTTTIENGSIGEVVSFSYDERPTTEVSLDKDSLNLLPTGSATLKATLTPVYSTEGVVWSSSDEGIATVNQSGVVTAVAVGEATITATSGSFSADCSVNVFRELINLADKSYQVAKPDGSDDFSETTTVSGYTLNLFNSCNNNGSNAYLAFLSKDRTTKNSLASNNTPAPGAITKICFVTTSGASGSAVYEAILSDTEVASVVSNENDKLIGKGSLTIVASALENLRYFAISCTTAGYNGQIEAIYINYETTEESIAHTPTRTALTYTYSNNGSFAYSSAAIRFGGFVPIALWDRLNNESTIQGYGVLLSTPSHLGGDELKDKYNEVDGTNVKKFDTDLEAAGIEHPSSANDAQKGGLVGDYYVWSLYKNITSENLQTEYTAVAYIRTASGVVFFGEVTYSAKTLAADYLNNRGYGIGDVEGSLYNLAHFGE